VSAVLRLCWVGLQLISDTDFDLRKTEKTYKYGGAVQGVPPRRIRGFMKTFLGTDDFLGGRQRPASSGNPSRRTSAL
jgi:hypothetical protein